jgi:PAS domain S-box-containing protein
MELAAVGMQKLEVEVPKARVLLVDDNADALRSMSAVLEILGEEVLTATNANQALKHLLKCEPAVIVLDVMMPEMDGFQLAAIIRQRERFRHTPIIFLTGLGKEDRHMLQGYQAGAVDYLLKPVDPDVLRSKVRIFVELSKKTELLRRYGDMMRSNSAHLEEALNETLRAKSQLEREISERRIAELTRDRLAGQLGAAPDFLAAMAEGAVTVAADGSVLYSNACFSEMVQRDQAELLGLPISSCVAPNHLENFYALLRESGRGRVTAEVELQSRLGDFIPAQLTLSPFRNADLHATAMVVTDLREQKRKEQMLAEGRLAKLVLEHSHSGIAVCDHEGRIILASRRIREITGENPLFRAFDELLPLEIGEHPGSPVRRFSAHEVLEGSVHKAIEATLVKNGRLPVSLLVSAGRVESDAGDTLGCVITLLDISERKAVEEVLRRSEKLAAAGRIAGTLAHEINNPLSAVTNLLFLLQNSGLEQAHQHYVDLAASELARVSRIARNTLSFYREAASPVPVQLSEVLDSVLELYQQQITAKSLRINKRYGGDCEVHQYPGELRQVFSNLIVNAIDALPQNGELLLAIRPRSGSDGTVKGASVWIADRGVGISRQNRQRLFEPFFTTKGEKGTGLGLWITHGIVQKQGGHIRVRSSNKPGESFTVFSVFVRSVLPANSNHNSAASAVAASSENEKSIGQRPPERKRKQKKERSA